MLESQNGMSAGNISVNEMMRTILVITIGYPHPQRGASSVLFYWYLRALRQSNFRVEHLLLASPDELSEQAEREYLKAIEPGAFFGVSVFPVQHVREAQRSGLDLYARELPDAVIEHVKSIQPEATVCFDLLAAEMAQRLRLDRLLIWLGDLSFQTILYHAYYDFKAQPRKFLRLARAYIGSFLWRRYYRRVLRGRQHIVVSSNSSVDILVRLGIKSTYWSYPWPKAVTTAVVAASKHDKPTFIMFGTLTALGSRSAFDFLLKSVYPVLLMHWGVRGFSILIAGMHELPSWVRSDIASRPEFSFLGFIDDLGTEVGRCHAVLAPISVPVGNRSRIVTALSMGALVIAHENTALGNPELVSGENCLLASSAAEFAEHMLRAYADPEKAMKIGAAAEHTYRRSFDPEEVSERLVLELESMFPSPQK